MELSCLNTAQWRSSLIGSAIALLLVVAWLWPAPPGALAQGDLTGTLLQLVNNFRAANGLPAWEVNGALMAAAQTQANYMTSSGQYGHTGEGGSTPQDRARAAGYSGIVYENYVYGTGLDPAGALQWWINSPIHLATLLSQTNHVGIGTVPGQRGTLYVLVAGRPSSVRTPDSSASSAPGGAASAPAEEVDPGPVVVPITLAEPDENGNVIHLVQQGQTAWAIAARYGVPLDDILDLNGFNLPVVLKPGDPVYIKLGPGQQPPPTATPQAFAVVQEGQTIWEIAVSQGLTVDELLELNGLTREDVIKPGDQLWLYLPEGVTRPGAPTPTGLESLIVMIFTPTPRLSPTPTSLLGALTASPLPPGATYISPTPTTTPTATPSPEPTAPVTPRPNLIIITPTSPSDAPPPTVQPPTATVPPATETPAAATEIPATPTPDITATPTLTPTATETPIVDSAPATAAAATAEAATAAAGTPGGQALAALPGATAAIGLPANVPAQSRASDSGSGPDWLVILGIASLAAVWLAVLGFGVLTWMGKRRA